MIPNTAMRFIFVLFLNDYMENKNLVTHMCNLKFEIYMIDYTYTTDMKVLKLPLGIGRNTPSPSSLIHFAQLEYYPASLMANCANIRLPLIKIVVQY